jgi:hypothetical protein
MSRPTTQKSDPMAVVLFMAFVYVVGITGGALLALGLDAVRHFLIWMPYAEFPWLLLRIGMVGGGFVSTLFLMLFLI